MKYIIPTFSAEHLGELIDEQIKDRGITDAKVIVPGRNKDGERHFPDGEVYSRIPEAQEGLFDKEHVIILHSGQRKPNTGIIECEYNIEIIREYPSPKQLDVFFAYYPYGRQDKKAESGEIAKAEKNFDKLRGWYKIDDIYIIDAHFAGRDHWDNVKRPFIDVKGVEVIKKRIEDDFPGEILGFFGPDEGSQLRAGVDGTEKKRKGSYHVKLKSEEEFLKKIKEYAYLVVLDDLSGTGETMLEFKNICKRFNPKAILIAGLTHGVKQKGINRTIAEYDRLYLGNTIKRDQTNVDFTELIMKNLGIL